MGWPDGRTVYSTLPRERMHTNDNTYEDNKMYAIEEKGQVGGIEMPAGAQSRNEVSGGGMRCLKTTIMALILTLALLGCAGAVTITVCESGCENNSIKSALNYSRAGDIIEVHGGTYYENLDIQRNVSLVGVANEKEMPAINGSGHGSVVVINIDGVNISGFKLTNSGDCGCGDSGLRIRSNNNTVYGNNITGNYYGVYAKIGSKGNRIFGNSFINNSVNIRDSGENQWYGATPPPSGILSMILGFLGLEEQEGYIGNYYGDYDEKGLGCKAEDNICSSPYNITVENNRTTNKDPYPLASPRL
jgi:parallel beta-helix repeat protein